MPSAGTCNWVSTNRILHRQLYEAYIKLQNFTARQRILHITLSWNQGARVTFAFFLKQIYRYMNHSMKPVHTNHHPTPLNKTKNLELNRGTGKTSFVLIYPLWVWFVYCFSPSISPAILEVCLHRIVFYLQSWLEAKQLCTWFIMSY